MLQVRYPTGYGRFAMTEDSSMFGIDFDKQYFCFFEAPDAKWTVEKIGTYFVNY